MLKDIFSNCHHTCLCARLAEEKPDYKAVLDMISPTCLPFPYVVYGDEGPSCKLPKLVLKLIQCVTWFGMLRVTKSAHTNILPASCAATCSSDLLCRTGLAENPTLVVSVRPLFNESSMVFLSRFFAFIIPKRKCVSCSGKCHLQN